MKNTFKIVVISSMSTSVRKEVLEQLYIQVQERGIVPLSHREQLHANKTLEEARRKYEEARRNVLRHELARYYRVVIFGSTRLGEDSEEFKFISDLAKSLVETRDVDIVTGGGPGIMKAAHYGARLATQEASVSGKRLRTKNYGVTLSTLPNQKSSGYFHFEAKHTEFSTRLQTFLDKTDASYNAQGGIGTLFEQLLLVQTKQIGHIETDYPILAHPFWLPIVDTWNDELYHRRVAKGRTPLISEEDLKLIRFTDRIPEIVEVISDSYDNWAKNIRAHIRIIP